jgi:hypothetical protein
MVFYKYNISYVYLVILSYKDNFSFEMRYKKFIPKKFECIQKKIILLINIQLWKPIINVRKIWKI